MSTTIFFFSPFGQILPTTFLIAFRRTHSLLRTRTWPATNRDFFLYIYHFKSAFLHNKTWIIHKTTPFYNYDKRQWTRYEGELLTYIAANAKNLASSALAAPTQRGAAATILNRSGPFPGQIDSSGNNVVETMDEVGDIRGVVFQVVSMNNTVDDLDEEVPGGVASTDALVITVTVKPKGNAA